MKQSLAGRLFRAIAARRGSIVAPLAPGWQHERELIAQTRRRTPLLLSDPAALHLLACARAACALAGDFAEAGVFKGGSARLICEQKGARSLHLFDVFERLQGSATGEGEQVRAHFGSVHGSEAQVRALLARYAGVRFHPGLFPGTAKGLEALRFAFVHLDMDLAEPTRAALDYFHPRMVPGAILLVDDYCEQFLKDCVDDWFAAHNDTRIELPWSQLMVIRQIRRDQLPTVNEPRIGE